MQGLETQNSSERIKLLVEREGKAARNLVTWSVPIADTVGAGRAGRARKVQGAVTTGASGSSHSNSRYVKSRKRDKGGLKGKGNPRGFLPLVPHVTKQTSTVGKPLHVGSHTLLTEREEICKYYSTKTQQRQSRSSKSPSKLNLHARYWSYLFDNLHRAVDEIYKTCDVDESIVECQVS